MRGSDKQDKFISALLRERATSHLDIPESCDVREASALITSLLAAPKVARDVGPKAERVTEPGTYLDPDTGIVYRVQKSRQGPGLYAKRLRHLDLEKPEWVYEPGLIRKVRVEWRMTLSAAMKWGIAHGICAVCGAILTDPESIQRGIGPVCAKRI